MPIMADAHRSSKLKQQNKKHNKLGHKTKGQIQSLSQGRQHVVSLKRRAKVVMNRNDRLNQVVQIRSSKREKTMDMKRSLGTDDQPPFLVCVVMLCQTLNPRQVMSALTQADPMATVTTSQTGATHIRCARFKQRFTFVIPPIDDLYAILDTVKVSNSVLLVWPCVERDEGVLTGEQHRLLSCIKAQGLPTTTHATMGYEQMASKRKSSSVQSLQLEIKHFFPDCDKLRVHHLDKSGEGLLCLRSIGAQKQRSIYYRDHRPHLMAEELVFVDDPNCASTGTLEVSGYIRGVALVAESLVHIPGWGDYHMSQVIGRAVDPHPLNQSAAKNSGSKDYVITPDPTKQQTLASCNEGADEEDSDADDDGDDGSNDGSDDGSVTSKSIKSYTTVPVKKDIIPGAYSSYQAAWMMDNDNYKEDDISDDCSDECDEFDAPIARDAAASDCDDDDEDLDDNASVTTDASGADEAYDDKVDYENEMDEYDRMQECREDLEFPDEFDTPRDVLARERFHKYRGLESFRTSPWDLSENLPQEYRKIFHIPRFNQFRKRVMAMEHNLEDNVVDVGEYVTVSIKDVQKHLYLEHAKTGSPLVMFGLLPHEQKMSVVNFVIKSHTTDHTRPIKSKDRLIFHAGFRRFSNQPIFSDHTAGDKQKYCRFFHPGMTVIASMYAPLMYPPASVLVFRELSGGRQELVATGSVYTADANRVVLKRLILSGHPFKIHKRSVVVRYMFFDRDDINWYKPIELRTKWGRKGKIKEALGTHGHMKCHFNGTLKSQDTILLNLYKRVFPKWKYDTHVPRPALMYSKDTFDDDDEDNEMTEEQKDYNRKLEKALMPPPSKKPRNVHFLI